MRSPIGVLFTALAFLAITTPGAVGALEGVVGTFGDELVEGTTSLPDEIIDLEAVSSRGLGSAFLDGTMSSLDLSTGANISGDFNSGNFIRAAESGAGVEFIDSVTVNAEGIADGTDLIVTIAWMVDGTLDFQTSDESILIRAELRMTGVEGQIWKRQNQNFGSPANGELGIVEFDFPVKAGEILLDNVFMASTATSTCGLTPSTYPNFYNASSSATMTVTLQGATDVRTLNGTRLFKWTTASRSGLDYGSKDEAAPLSDPDLRVSNSPAGKGFAQLSWPSAPGEVYKVETGTNLLDWEEVTEVIGTGDLISINLRNTGREGFYRLVSELGTGNPGDTPVAPTLIVGAPSESFVRLIWKSNHWEKYQIFFSDDLVTFTPQGESIDGTGGEIVIDLPITVRDQCLYRVEAQLK